MTARELALGLIRPYVLRGDEPETIYGGMLGCSSDDGSASCGGYLGGKWYPTKKVVVSRIGPWDTGKAVAEVFDFFELFEEIKSGVRQMTQQQLF